MKTDPYDYGQKGGRETAKPIEERRAIDPSRLSPRELEMYTLAQEGKTYNQIADDLGIARGTVAHGFWTMRNRNETR